MFLTPRLGPRRALEFVCLGLPLLALTPASAQQVLLDKEDYLTPAAEDRLGHNFGRHAQPGSRRCRIDFGPSRPEQFY